jgi:hypothetical protein
MVLGGPMPKYVDCKKGLHRYSPAGQIGGGIARRTCSLCRVVQIDLSDGSAVSDTNLFTGPKLATMFEVEALLAKVGDKPVMLGRSFGDVPAGKRRPARAFR